jgi:hypothetical protein
VDLNGEFKMENMRINLEPEYSDWSCWLMGDYGKSQYGAVVYRARKGMEPNWFHRKMQELCFGFQWRKTTK